MQTIYKLNNKDIEEIIAQHYKVNIENVHVKTERISVGYGILEHDEYLPTATIEIDG